MKITYDPNADALYVSVQPVGENGAGQTEVDEAGVIIDTDASGRPRGYEFLSVRSSGIPTGALPADVADAIQRFIANGALEAGKYVETEY